MSQNPQELLRVAGIGRYRGISAVQASKNLKDYPLPPDFIAGTVRLWKPETVQEWAADLPKSGGRPAVEREKDKAKLLAKIQKMPNQPQELWRVIDIAKYRGVSKVQAHYNLENYPLEPDYFAGKIRFWQPSRVEDWAKTLPTKGKWVRPKKNTESE